jgi:hypothetical protein
MYADPANTRTMPADVSGALWRMGAAGPYDIGEQAPTQDTYPKSGKGKKPKVKMPPFGSLFKTPAKDPGEPFSDGFESRHALQDELDDNFFFFFFNPNISIDSEG